MTDTVASSGAERMTEAADEPAGRQRILDVAAGLFLQQGYAETSLRHIAAEAGMKAGSLYYHFDSKGDLLTAILRRGIDVMIDAFEKAADVTGQAQPRERIVAHVRAHLGALFEHGPYTAAHVITFTTAPPKVRETIVPVRDSYEALWSALLDELAATGALDNLVDVGLDRLVLFGAMNSTIEWFDPARSSLDELADIIANQFWRGVAADDRR